MKINFKKIGDGGASLLEVVIAMIILTIGFLGVMALSVALTNDNATASKVNTATTIAQAEVSQLNCLGINGIQQYFPQITPWTYTYTVNPTILTPDTRNPVNLCINPVLAKNGSVPNAQSSAGLGITLPYTVTINFSENVNPAWTTVINAQVEVSWQDMGPHVIVMNDLIS